MALQSVLVVNAAPNEPPLKEAKVATLKEIELDFGAPAVRNKTFTVLDTDVTVNSLILANQSAKAATGRSQDENELESILFKAVAGTGQFTLYAQVLNNSLVAGKYRVTYLVGG